MSAPRFDLHVVVVTRRLPKPSRCCCKPWRSIVVTYEATERRPPPILTQPWPPLEWAVAHDAYYTHGRALVAHLKTLPAFKGRIRCQGRRPGFYILVYQGRGTIEDHRLFERLERDVLRLRGLSTVELKRRSATTQRLP